MKRFIITTLGCKVNRCESDALAEALKTEGWYPAPDKESADLCIINTCTVTQKASMQSRQAIRQIIRASPRARVIVTGCYAEIGGDEIKKIEGVFDVVGHEDKLNIPEMLKADKSQTGKRKTSVFDFQLSTSRTRPFLKIQDGCDAFCTYCIVPYTRGRSRSMPLDDVLENIRKLKAAGYREAVLAGIHLGCYGLDLSPAVSLSELIRRINESKVMDRVRLSSVEPNELSDEIIRLVAMSDHLCRHFHIPLQSGDDNILKRMHRPYTAQFFRESVMNIRTAVPDAAIGTDILVGFPGESKTAFENTYSLIEQLSITYLHVFPFSPRKGTPAETYPDRVPLKVIKQRCQDMRELGVRKKNEFYKKLIGKTVEILIESKRDKFSGLLKGITSNYVPVLTDGDDSLKNTFVQVRIEEINGSNRVRGQRFGVKTSAP
jgi:threonylcarbamoyladenosine tRNA methylthiotransferase MtaB